MPNKTRAQSSNSPNPFIQKHQEKVIGILHGFDRLRFSGCLRALYHVPVMKEYLDQCNVLFKDFKGFALNLTGKVKTATLALAQRAGRPVVYLPSSNSCKETVALSLAKKDGIQTGLIGVLSCVENCRTYTVGGNPKTKHLELQLKWGKCLHYYFYFLHARFGLMPVRLQTWFPFLVNVCLNGRDWLACQMNQAGLDYEQRDKQGSILRVETTINRPEEFKVYRAKETEPKGPKAWRELRRGVVDLPRRAQVSRAANERYYAKLASVEPGQPLGQQVERLCRPLIKEGHRYRGLNPWSPKDARLLAAINRGEFALSGFRNRDLRQLLFPGKQTAQKTKCQAGGITRQLRLLRAHGLIKKVTGSHRYQLTKTGQTLITALLAARDADVAALTKLAA